MKSLRLFWLILILICQACAGSDTLRTPAATIATAPTPTDLPTATPTPTATEAATATPSATASHTPAPVTATPSKAPLNIKKGYFAQTFNYRGVKRDYMLYLPESYDGERSYPLLVGLHPLNSTAHQFAIGMAWLAPAQEKQMIAVYPQGMFTPNEQSGSWNALHCCGYAKEQGIDDLGFIRALVTYVKAQYKVDAKRIYAAGYSNGGDMAHYLGSEMSEVFAAIGEYAGAMGSASSTQTIVYRAPRNRVSVIKLHGKKDTTRPYEGGWDGPHALQYVSVNSTMKFWAQADGCALTPTVSKIDGGSWQTYENCKDKTNVIHIAFDNADHAYPASATRLITQFLITQSKP